MSKRTEDTFVLKLVNVALRIGGMGSKFLIFTLMSKYLEGNVFGDYSLIISIITILIFVLGLDFYNFSIRDILATSSLIEVRSKIYTTFVVYGFIYVFFIFCAYKLFSSIEYIKPYKWLIILLCITEHLSQEIYRLLIGFKKVLLANILLFVRTMGWSLIIFYYVIVNIEITLDLIFKLWLGTNLLTIFYVVINQCFKNYKYFKEIKLDFSWVKKGLRVCYLFFIATIALKSIEYANRFIVDYYLGKELAGIFTFYSSISILITVYINTMVLSYELPLLISFAKTDKIFGLLKKFKKSIFIQLCVASLLLLIIIKPLLIWQNKPIFESYLPLIFFMITGVGLMNYSLIYHFKLYIFHKDLSIFKIMILSSVISLFLAIIGTHFYGLYGSASAFVLSGLVMFYFRKKEANKINL